MVSSSSELIICQGTGSYQLDNYSGQTYVYRIGGANVCGRKCIDINDAKRLNAIAEQLRDEYSVWIEGLRGVYRQNLLSRWGVPIFFFTDISCKRTELFDTYNAICSLVLISEKLHKVRIDTIRLFGINHSFVFAIKSVFPNVDLVINGARQPAPTLKRLVLSDLRHLFNTAVVILVCRAVHTHRTDVDIIARKYFFSISPKMTDTAYFDKKYADFVEESDRYLVTVLTDGMHQRLSIRQYVNTIQQLDRDKIVLIDKFLRFRDVAAGIAWWLRLISVLFRTRKTKYWFRGINISGFIQHEQVVSHARVWRLIVFGEALSRCVSSIHLSEIVYYLFEYPLGRVITTVIGDCFPNVRKTGFQHGPASWRKLICFLGRGKDGPNEDQNKDIRVPDRILVEDEKSREIYDYTDYDNVQIMKKIYRLGYLSDVAITKETGNVLIAPGLNDGPVLLEAISETVKNETETIFILKPHPLANNGYVTSHLHHKNIKLTEKSVSELLSSVSKVYVTYSSVGIEADTLGIEVIVVDVPGVVSQSPLHDNLDT